MGWGSKEPDIISTMHNAMYDGKNNKAFTTVCEPQFPHSIPRVRVAKFEAFLSMSLPLLLNLSEVTCCKVDCN